MKPTEKQLRREIVDIGRKMYAQGFVAATDGNISVKLHGGLVLVTPSGVPKGELKEEDLVVVDLQGRTRFGRRKPTTEFRMHLRIYAQRPDVEAVVHAHPPISTGFACAGVPLDQPIATEVILQLGKVPLAPYGTPGTEELPETLMCCIRDHNAMLMANHGAVTYGKDLKQAWGRMETVEQFAKIMLVTKMLGRQNPLSDAEVAKIVAARSSYFS
ncbi:MAG: aldolase [Elusimicrobia bacterium CG1_02_63_36]|nr:MAG: aldolase [Elusimicrobia bacterium CG1_02_63_36]